MAIIRIVDLKARTIIGTYPWERKNKQDLIINITMEYDSTKAAKSDNIKDALDYDRISKKVMATIDASSFHLLEKLAATLLKVVLSDKRVINAKVKLDKPHAISEAKYISFETQGQN